MASSPAVAASHSSFPDFSHSGSSPSTRSPEVYPAAASLKFPVLILPDAPAFCSPPLPPPPNAVKFVHSSTLRILFILTPPLRPVSISPACSGYVATLRRRVFIANSHIQNLPKLGPHLAPPLRGLDQRAILQLALRTRSEPVSRDQPASCASLVTAMYQSKLISQPTRKASAIFSSPLPARVRAPLRAGTQPPSKPIFFRKKMRARNGSAARWKTRSNRPCAPPTCSCKAEASAWSSSILPEFR